MDDITLPKGALKKPGKLGKIVFRLSDKPKSRARSMSMKDRLKEKEEEELKKRAFLLREVLGG